MPVLVGVRFRNAGKLYHFETGNLPLHRLDKVVVETAQGLGLGRVVTEPKEEDGKELPRPVRRVVRKATDRDLEQERACKERQEAALGAATRRVKALNLPMRLVEAESNLDGSRMTLTFTAESRVDFRQLVRDLSSTLQCRIDLRQVGARDEAKVLDGIGPCGERLCCSRWMTEFQPVSIKMAKLQGLALNPGKLAGVCGRLKCCLRYEVENYDPSKLPVLGAKVYTTEGEGRVVALNLPEQKVSVLGDDPAPKWYPADEVFSHNGCSSGGGGGACSCKTK